MPHQPLLARPGWGAHFSLVDEVELPLDLQPGGYLLSWRWDTEGTHQVWQNCADVMLV